VTEAALEALVAQMERLLGEFAEMRREMADMRAAMLHIKRDSQIKDILGRIDGQVRKLEKEKERAAER
jgi:hypothetical protein